MTLFIVLVKIIEEGGETCYSKNNTFSSQGRAPAPVFGGSSQIFANKWHDGFNKSVSLKIIDAQSVKLQLKTITNEY